MSLKKTRRCFCYLTAMVILTIIVAFIALSSQDDVVFMRNPAVNARSDEKVVGLKVPVHDKNVSERFHLKEITAKTTWILTNSSGDAPDSVSCKALAEGSTEEQKRATAFMSAHARVPITPDDYIRWTRDCEDFRSRRKYIMEALPEEVNFPLAYSIIMFKDVEQVERLLRTVYRPHNYVCIHVDGKANAKVKDAMAAIASCLPGVFVHPKPLKVVWGSFSVLESELICMKALLSQPKWRYFINLTGQEFPLKTNLELVRILSAYNGSNDVEGVIHGFEENKKTRWERAGPLPLGLFGVKGSVHVVVNRHYVHFALTHQSALLLMQWVNKTHIPDETFFATLNHNQKLQVPGGYSGRYWTDGDAKPFLARYKIWADKLHCTGKFVRSVCIFAIGDLPALTSARELIANKFYLEYSPLTLDCLELWYHKLVEEELRTKGGNSRLDLCWYRTRGFVEHHFPLSNLTSEHFLLPDLYSISAAVSSSSAWEGGHTDATPRQH